MIHVYLDDYRPCPRGFTLATNAEECTLLLQECEVDILSLDYDLGWGQETGMDVVRRLIASGRYPRRIYLHTSSVSGRLRMFEALYMNKPPQVELTNGPMPVELIMEIAKYME
ncbi:cyclic-phosphate processing receiver domain-containing protein [Paenibacillus silviterrae]|jgi:hypothetical protein|uniref:cyclic-phosphate processing receiver domain-containing protein n=1 Tax=Paenibacillus silviterrae TaxID=3242194 RepID=UPI0025437A68|nr:cyclic-phosphate processing receiver domain-containing protein [Paenibacillus chinjuensis]